MDDDLLIDLVEGYPILYDRKHLGFKNNAKKQAVWERVAQGMECDVDSVKRRWINLRERFSKEIRHKPAPPENSDSDAPPPRQWAYLGRLLFLQKHIIQRPFRRGPITPRIELKPPTTTNRNDPLELMEQEAKLEPSSPKAEHSYTNAPNAEMNATTEMSPSPPSLASPARSGIFASTPPPLGASSRPQSQPQPSSSQQRKRKADDDPVEVGEMLIKTAKIFREICEQKARTPTMDPEISGFTTMIGAAIARLKTKRRVTVIQRCTQIVMQAAIEEEDESYYK